MTLSIWPVTAQVIYAQAKEPQLTSPSADELINPLNNFNYSIATYYVKINPPACPAGAEKSEAKNDQFKAAVVKLALEKLGVSIYVTDSDANGFFDSIDLCQEFADNTSIVIGQARKKGDSWQVELDTVTYNQKHKVESRKSLPLDKTKKVMARIFSALTHKGYYQPDFKD